MKGEVSYIGTVRYLIQDEDFRSGNIDYLRILIRGIPTAYCIASPNYNNRYAKVVGSFIHR